MSSGKFLRKKVCLLESFGVFCLCLKRYVDDVNGASRMLGRRVRMVVREGMAALEEGGEEVYLEEDDHTASIFWNNANNLMPRSVDMEEDVASNQTTTGKLHILLETWVKKNTILHQFYRKPMASRAVVLIRSAFTTKDILNIIMAEGDRRLSCSSLQLSWRTQTGLLTDLNIQLMDCGQSPDFRDMVISRIVARYQDSLARHMRGEGSRNIRKSAKVVTMSLEHLEQF